MKFQIYGMEILLFLGGYLKIELIVPFQTY